MRRGKVAIGMGEVRGELVEGFRCWRCNRLHAELAGPGTRVRCPRCGAHTSVPVADSAGDSPGTGRANDGETEPAGKSPGRSKAKTTQ